MSTASDDPRPFGSLTAYAPFTTSQLNVYDQSFKRVASATGFLYVQLPQGIYEVETISGSQRESKLVIVSPEKQGLVSWQRSDLQIRSAAPLAGTSTIHDAHIGPAIQYSRQITMPGPKDADSRLFIFVRTLEPQRYQDFDQGLRLFDANGKLLSNFKEGVWRDPVAGCLALTVDLPAGFYQIYRGGRGRKARYQAIWLSEGWETQVFIPSRDRPLLSDVSIFMARRGSGFNPDDDLTLAAETVLEGLQRGINLIDSDMMRDLLGGKFENPWLGVLALHTMRLDPNSDRGGLRSIVEANVRNMLGDHPDARALFLRPDRDAEQPFDTPPMLYASLRLVQEHATSYANTIPPSSLTARLLNHLIADSPWASWRTIEAPVPIDEPWESYPPAEDSADEDESDQKARAYHELLVEQSERGGPALEDLALLAEQAPFDVSPPVIRYPLDPQARLLNLKADEFSQLSGLPLSQVEKALDRLQTQPERMEKAKLGMAERTIVQEVLRPVRRVLPAEGELSQQDLHANLLATIQRLEQLPARSKQVRTQALEWAASLKTFNASLEERQDGILITTHQAAVVYANPGWQHLSGYTHQQLTNDSRTGGNPLLQNLERLESGLNQVELPTKAGRSIAGQLLKLEVWEESHPELLVARLYKFQAEGANPPDQSELAAVRQTLSNLRLYASLLVYGEADQKAVYQQHMIQEVQSLSAA